MYASLLNTFSLAVTAFFEAVLISKILLQPVKAQLPIPSIVLLMYNVSMLLHPAKAYAPMLLTPSQMVALLSSLQLLNASFPIVVTLFGIVTLVRLEQP